MTSSSEQPNPYAPPREPRGSRTRKRSKRPAPGEGVKWVYGAVAIAQAASVLVLVLGLTTTPAVQDGLTTLATKLPWALAGLALVWIYHAWSGLPLELRDGIAPGGAVLRLLAPGYGFYWMFAVNARIGRAIDALLQSVDDPRRAPGTLAAAAAALVLIVDVMALAGAGAYLLPLLIVEHALWMAYMIQCDALRRAALRIRWTPNQD